MSLCIVFFCNSKYFPKFKQTLHQLRNAGEYKGEIVLAIGDDLLDKQESIQNEYDVTVKHFPDIVFNDKFLSYFNTIKRDGLWRNKIFQYHKFYLFDEYFKQWKYIFYLDCGVKIFRPIQTIIDSKSENTMLARNDPWGPFINKWSLATQFDMECDVFPPMNQLFHLDTIKNYFQTTIMLFDTQIIESTTFQDLNDLANKYPCSITNDQAIIALYYICINPKWKELPIEDDIQYFYDYKPRNNKKPYIIHKWH